MDSHYSSLKAMKGRYSLYSTLLMQFSKKGGFDGAPRVNMSQTSQVDTDDAYIMEFTVGLSAVNGRPLSALTRLTGWWFYSLL